MSQVISSKGWLAEYCLQWCLRLLRWTIASLSIITFKDPLLYVIFISWPVASLYHHCHCLMQTPRWPEWLHKCIRITHHRSDGATNCIWFGVGRWICKLSAQNTILENGSLQTRSMAEPSNASLSIKSLITLARSKPWAWELGVMVASGTWTAPTSTDAPDKASHLWALFRACRWNGMNAESVTSTDSNVSQYPFNPLNEVSGFWFPVCVEIHMWSELHQRWDSCQGLPFNW